MNVAEAKAAQVLLQALTNVTPDGEDLPTIVQVAAAAEVLADRSSGALKTGITGERTVEALKVRRGYPYRLKLAVSKTADYR